MAARKLRAVVSQRVAMARNCVSLAKKFSDQMTCLREIFVTVAMDLAIASGRNGSALARLGQGPENPLLGIMGFIGKDGLGLQVRQQDIRAVQVAGLARGQVKAGRIAQRIGRGVDRGAQAAFTASHRLVVSVFLGAPALC